jgi:transcription antitermination protein NusB
MSIRHESRKVLMQTLYELDTSHAFALPALEAKEILKRNMEYLSPGRYDVEFTCALFDTILERLITLDELIVKAAPEWPMNKINIVDRNVLRIGLSEMLFNPGKDVPPKVAIDEAIEVAKEFGGESSGKFVNGVLGAVYKELDVTEGVEKHKKLKKEYKSGLIVLRLDNDSVYIAMLMDKFKTYTLPRSDLEEGGDEAMVAKSSAVRDFGIEIGEATFVDQHSYIAHHPEKGNIVKIIKYYYGVTNQMNFNGVNDEEILATVWVNYDDIDKIKIYKDLKPVIQKAIEMNDYVVDKI